MPVAIYRRAFPNLIAEHFRQHAPAVILRQRLFAMKTAWLHELGKAKWKSENSDCFVLKRESLL